MLGEDDTSSITDLAARADALMDAEAAKEHAVFLRRSNDSRRGDGPRVVCAQEEAGLVQEQEAGAQEEQGQRRQTGPGPMERPGHLLVPLHLRRQGQEVPTAMRPGEN